MTITDHQKKGGGVLNDQRNTFHQEINSLDFPIAIGERGKRSQQARNRLVGKKLIRVIAEYLMEQPIPDYNSGFRAFRRRPILAMLSIMPNGFSFSTTSTLAFTKLGYEVGLLPIEVADSRMNCFPASRPRET